MWIVFGPIPLLSGQLYEEKSGNLLRAISKIPFGNFQRLGSLCFAGFFVQTPFGMSCKSRLA
jgi:hypothetical protein